MHPSTEEVEFVLLSNRQHRYKMTRGEVGLGVIQVCVCVYVCVWEL